MFYYFSLLSNLNEGYNVVLIKCGISVILVNYGVGVMFGWCKVSLSRILLEILNNI